MNISQIKYVLTFTPQNVSGGCRIFTHAEFKNLTIENCQSKWMVEELENYKAFQVLYLKQIEIHDPILRLFMEIEINEDVK